MELNHVIQACKVKRLLIAFSLCAFFNIAFAHNHFLQGTAVIPMYRINAGGGELASGQGMFAADGYYLPMPGDSYSTTRSISGTSDYQLYQSQRFGPSGTFGYSLPVANGNYTVVLHFAEIYWEEIGKRIFDVTLEGTKVLDDFDIIKKVGAFTATTETFTANVYDGLLNIDFSSLAMDGGVDCATVSAIEVLSITTTEALQVTSFTLVNAATGQDIQTLTNGVISVASLTEGNINIRANINAATVGSVLFNLSGEQTIATTENVAPYALFGDNNGIYNGHSFSLGEYTLTATPFPGVNGNGIAGFPLTVKFKITNVSALPAPVITFSASPVSDGSATLTWSTVNATSCVAFGAWSGEKELAGNYSTGIINRQIYTLTCTGAGGTTSNSVTVSGQNLSPVSSNIRISGSLRKWQVVTLNLDGPFSSQTSTSPNPFLDYKLQAVFTHDATGKSYNVPGFFDGDGTGGGMGNQWKVRFNPDEEGTWSYLIYFRSGAGVAIDLNPSAGIPESPDGTNGNFSIAAFDPDAPGFQSKGRLYYSNEHYLKFQDGSHWIKGGTDSPENFLALSYPNHVKDWQTGDPEWNKGLIGALNYLGEMNINSIYFLPMNIGGDGQDTWPFVGTINKSGSWDNDNLHYDINKLANWEHTFEHAQKKGILLHFVLNEAETANKLELDNATLGTERKLYYRELVARFSHHNALQWNLCEEYDLDLQVDPNMIKSWAQYIQDIDCYTHPITVHNTIDPEYAWQPFIGDSRFSSTSFQFQGSNAGGGKQVEKWRIKTGAAGRPIPIYLDELNAVTTSNMADQRKEILWPTYFSGGAGLEYYFGGLDQSLQDFRPYSLLLQWTWYARKFMLENLPFWEMQPADDLLTGESEAAVTGQVLAKAGQVYAVYLPNASQSGTLSLVGIPGYYLLRWYNPRTGNFEGNSSVVNGESIVTLGAAPGSEGEDWVVLITNIALSVVNASGNEIPRLAIQAKPSTPKGLQVKVVSNPSSDQFTVVTKSSMESTLKIRVIDHLGRTIETRAGIVANGTLQLGNNYLPGLYYAEVVQGKENVIIKLLKQSN